MKKLPLKHMPIQFRAPLIALVSSMTVSVAAFAAMPSEGVMESTDAAKISGIEQHAQQLAQASDAQTGTRSDAASADGEKHHHKHKMKKHGTKEGKAMKGDKTSSSDAAESGNAALGVTQGSPSGAAAGTAGGTAAMKSGSDMGGPGAVTPTDKGMTGAATKSGVTAGQRSNDAAAPTPDGAAGTSAAPGAGTTSKDPGAKPKSGY